MQDLFQSDSILNGTTIPDTISGAAPLLDVADAATSPSGLLDIFHGYLPVFVVAFVITLLATPLMRSLALANNVVDHPDSSRKLHARPIAYLGGAAVFLGLLAGIATSLFGDSLNIFGDNPKTAIFVLHDSVYTQKMIPFSIIIGMTIIMMTGLIDDLIGISPRIKIAGQLFAAAALAMEDVGVKVAQGVLSPIGKLFGNSELLYAFEIPLPVPIMGGEHITIDMIYWTGTAIIAIGIIGACNASNLVDGLDGLLSGVTAIAMAGLLVIALTLAQQDDGILDTSRIVLIMAVAGACLGFLPHNFKPASIFLGDAGSQMLGYLTIVIIFTLGDTGRTDLVVAGLIIYALPIIDTTLAIVRRKMAGLSVSEGDHQHLHHMLKRAYGVIPAVLLLYGISVVFAALGIFVTLGRDRVAYTIALIFASFIGVTAVKMASLRSAESKAAVISKARTNHPPSHKPAKPTVPSSPDPVG
jgi:UDP-GlcNAc:undecaprenyl-phosphate/decaprenyl-phosphate GlcNAc-1-phosphate transferase